MDSSFDHQITVGYPSYRTYNKNYTVKVRFYSEKLCYVIEDNNIEKHGSLSNVTIDNQNNLVFTSPRGIVYTLIRPKDDYWTFLPDESGYEKVLN